MCDVAGQRDPLAGGQRDSVDRRGASIRVAAPAVTDGTEDAVVTVQYGRGRTDDTGVDSKHGADGVLDEVAACLQPRCIAEVRRVRLAARLQRAGWQAATGPAYLTRAVDVPV